MNRWEKLLIVAGAVVCALVIGAAVYNACTTITYSQGLGLSTDQITKVSITTGYGGYVATMDPQKIQELMDKLGPQKLQYHPFGKDAVGEPYCLDVYSSGQSFFYMPGQSFKSYDASGFFHCFGDFAGSKLSGCWQAEDSNAAQTIMSFYIELGGQPVE